MKPALGPLHGILASATLAAAFQRATAPKPHQNCTSRSVVG